MAESDGDEEGGCCEKWCSEWNCRFVCALVLFPSHTGVWSIQVYMYSVCVRLVKTDAADYVLTVDENHERHICGL